MRSTHHSGFRLECDLHNGFSSVQQPCRAASRAKESKKKKEKKKIQNHPNLKPAQTCGGARFCSSAGAGEVWLTDGLFLFDKKKIKIKIDVCVEHARPDQSIKEELRLAEADFSGFSEESERLNGSSCCIWRRETV